MTHGSAESGVASWRSPFSCTATLTSRNPTGLKARTRSHQSPNQNIYTAIQTHFIKKNFASPVNSTRNSLLLRLKVPATIAVPTVASEEARLHSSLPRLMLKPGEPPKLGSHCRSNVPIGVADVNARKERARAIIAQSIMMKEEIYQVNTKEILGEAG